MASSATDRRSARLQATIDRSRAAIARSTFDLNIAREKLRRLDAIENAGPGHEWTPWESLPGVQETADMVARIGTAFWEYAASRDALGRMRGPRCVHCEVGPTSDVGRRPCPGDAHHCPHEDPNGTFRQYERPTTCGLNGMYSKGRATWTCQAGHTLAARHPDRPAQWPYPATCGRLDCPCRHLNAPTDTTVAPLA